MLSIVLYAPFWIFGGLIKRRRRPAERAMRLWPLVAVLSLLAFVGIFMLCSDDLIDRLGNQTVWSEALFLCTVCLRNCGVVQRNRVVARAERVGAPRGSRLLKNRHDSAADFCFVPGLLGCHRTQDMELGVSRGLSGAILFPAGYYGTSERLRSSPQGHADDVQILSRRLMAIVKCQFHNLSVPAEPVRRV